MRRLLIATALLAPVAACRTRTGDAAPEITPPPAQVGAPARLTRAGVTDPPTPAPTAPNTWASMTPPFMQHTPPRPSTRTSGTAIEATPAAMDSAPAPESTVPVTRVP